jgi:phage host-nuclease inhibitor protein Gam
MPEPRDDYEAFLDLLHPGGTETAERFAVLDDSAADWALRKLGALEAQSRKRQAFLATEIERLKTWEQHERSRDQRAMDCLTGALRTYYEALRDGGALGKRKSYTLPHGRLTARQVPTEFDIDDHEALMEWATRKGWVRVSYELDWQELKPHTVPLEEKAFSPCIDDLTGEIIPGVRVKQPTHDVFSAKPSID